MALRVNSITVQFTRLPLGISWTGLRFKSSTSNREKELAASTFAKHHGEKIWIYSHILEGMTVYSHRPVLKANKALRQLSFNGKKLKPSKFRRDYWRPFAMIQFPEGLGNVGQNVYQRLRECKKLHELSWDNDMFYDKEGKPLTKHERGSKINDQKTNTVADIAAVLGGLGKGNLIWMTVSQDPKILANLEAGDDKHLKKESDAVKARVKAQVWWADDQDRHFAKSWPPNVTHHRFDQAAIEEMGWDAKTLPEQDSKSGEAAKEGEDQEGTDNKEAADQKPADQKEVGQKRTDQKEAGQKNSL